MDRFFADSYIKDQAFITDLDEIKHITKVMRFKIGDKVELISGDKKEFIGQINEICKERITLEIVDQIIKNRELECRITIYQAIPKGQKMDFIIQKTTELGVDRIIPCNMKRCVSNIGEKEDKKILRWQKIAQEASKQSKRLIVPSIENTMHLGQIVEDMKKNQVNMVFYESEENLKIKDYIKKIKNSGEKILSAGIIIGPEGGLEENECFLFSQMGAKTVSLGDRILRTETAAIYGAAVLAYEFE